MARVFITGSADGLRLLAAKALIDRGHRVVLHARNEWRAGQTLNKISNAENILTGDLGSIDETKELAAKVNASGKFDAVIYNAGVSGATVKELFAVNTLAPYILTCMIEKPKRLIYLSSGMHLHGHFQPDIFKSGSCNYSDTKLHLLMLCKTAARKWTDVYANALNPGWVPTKMGGRAAPDNLQKGVETQVWLAASNDVKAKVSGKYFFHQHESRYNPQADDELLQEKFLNLCKEITGVSFPG